MNDLESVGSVDVVVPCYNYGRFLRRCVNSILAQEGVHVRVLIIDDASSDESADIARALTISDPRVTFHRHTSNLGHIATYNEGLLEWASAKYSLLISADDVLVPGALSRAAFLMNGEAEVGMVYGMAVVITDDAELGAIPLPVDHGFQVIGGLRFLRRMFEFGNSVPTPTAVVRTSVQHLVGGYRSDLPHSGDLEMWMRFAVHGAVGIIRDAQAYYRWHGANMGVQYYTSQIRDRAQVVEACKRVFSTSGYKFPESGAWMDAMCKRFAEEAFWTASKAFDRNDLLTCKTHLSFARELYPPLFHSYKWRRFQIKQLLAPNTWNTLRSLVGRRPGNNEAPLVPEMTGLQAGTILGWWPEAD